MAEPLITALHLSPYLSPGILAIIWLLLSHLCLSSLWDADVDPHLPGSSISPPPCLLPTWLHRGAPWCSSHGPQPHRVTYSLGSVTLVPTFSPLHQARAHWLALPCHFWETGSGCLEFCAKKDSEAMWQRVLWLICYVCRGGKNGSGSMCGMCICHWYPILH